MGDIFSDFRRGTLWEMTIPKRWRWVEGGIEIDLPGVKRENVKVTLDDGELEINYKERLGKRGTYSFKLSKEVKEVTAKLEDGVLFIGIEMKEREKREIEVK